MKRFIYFLVTFLIFVSFVSYQHIFSKTKYGAQVEIFESLPSKLVIPTILIDYLRNASIRYECYKIPNYVKDFLTKNIDYGSVYNSTSNYTIILFKPEHSTDKNYVVFDMFYNTLSKEIKSYGEVFSIIYKHDLSNKDIYKDPYDKIAFEDLKSYCHSFCLINKSNDTMFTFKNLTNTEVEAIDVLLQQYNDMVK